MVSLSRRDGPTAEEAFKYGFLSRCIADGVGWEEMERRAQRLRSLVKAAAPSAGAAAARTATAVASASGLWDSFADKGSKTFKWVWEKVFDKSHGLLGSPKDFTMRFLLPFLLLTPTALGMAAGLLAGTPYLLVGVDDKDLEAMRNEEIIRGYQTQTQLLEKRLQARKYQQEQQQLLRKPRLFL